MNDTKFFTDAKLPFLELRYSKSKLDYKEHIHNTFSIGAIIKGKRVYTNKNNYYTICKNHLAIVNPNTIHSCNSINNEESFYYMLYLNKAYLKSLFQTENFLEFKKELVEDKESYNEFLKLCKVIFSNEFYIKKEQYLINFILNLYKKHSDFKEEYTKDKLKISNEIVDYLHKKVDSDITLEELSKKFNLSKFYLLKLFKKELGTTIYTYFINLKIEYAKKLLKKNMPISEVALESGFFDQSHFHRNFIKFVATTPKKYQNNFVQ
ncbi:AraC family transcriptional regulator [Malaciobacter canalis]|uniref:AraC family transcriptional regulator n=1 Tax=Malaciobacter canalis TaxID=1912871 RepID=UPI00384E3395